MSSAETWCRQSLVLVGFSALIGLACQRPADGPVRLVDVADRSVMAQSPLLTPVVPQPPSATEVWTSDFEGDALARLGWPDYGREWGGAWLEDDPAHGQVLCVGADGSEQFSIHIPARALTRYRVTRVLDTEWSDFDLRLVELSTRPPRRVEATDVAARIRNLRDTRTVFAKGAVLAVHRFARPAVGSWDRAELEFVSNLDTRTLALAFERVRDPSRPLVASACLARLVVERLEASPRQDLEWLREAKNVARAGEDAPGLVKRGRLLPLRRLMASRAPYDENYGVRDALFAPAPSRLRFPLELPPQARFAFSYGLSAGSRIGDEVDFEVMVEAGGGSRRVFHGTAAIGRRGEGWHWYEGVVDLSPWAGDRIVLELRTTTSTPRGFGLWGDPVIAVPRPVGARPNLVLIGIDTLRADRLSAYGYGRPTSPHLERLAADGVRFGRAISASNWTVPSFASIFTGLTPASHGVVNEEFRMNEAVETLAERLREGGWRTHAVAYKAALFGLGLDEGFDRWLNLPTSNRTAQDNLDKALAMIDREGDQRFFLFLHLDDPHQPFNQPPPYDRRFSDPGRRDRLGFELPVMIRNSAVRGCDRCVERGQPTDDFVHEAQALYDAAVAYTDDRIGQLVAALRERGLYDDTVIAVVSDHGEVIYDRHRLWGHGALLLADEMVHVPLIVKPAAGAGPAGVVVESQVRTTDLLPTLLEAVGLTAPDGPDARSLWPLVEADGEDRVAFFENPQRRVIGLRTGEWKYVLRSHAGKSYGQLYDLAADPAETVNLALERPRVVAELDELLARFLLRTREGPFLLVVGDGEPGTYRLTLDGAEPGGVRALLGLAPQSAGAGEPRRTAGGGRVLALARVDFDPEGRIAATLSRDGRPLNRVEALGAELAGYDPGTWERLLSDPGVYFLRGPAQVGAARVGRPTNVDQVEDLRALGYID